MNIRCRFGDLVNHLKTKIKTLGVALENFDDAMAQIRILPGGRNETEEGWHFANLRYRGVLSIERISNNSAVLAMLYIRAWLDEHDDQRDRYKLGDPEASIIPLDNSCTLVDLEVEVDFNDPVYLNMSDDNMIDWQSGSFNLSDYDLWIAENGTVNTAPIILETGNDV